MVGIGHERPQGTGNKDVSALNASCIGMALGHRQPMGEMIFIKLCYSVWREVIEQFLN